MSIISLVCLLYDPSMAWVVVLAVSLRNLFCDDIVIST